MRLRKNQLKQYNLKKAIPNKTNEGSSYIGYSEDPFVFLADISPASGKIQAEMYGTRLSYILNMLCYPIEVKENDGICIYVSYDEEPDYKVISIKRYSQHFVCELEKI